MPADYAARADEISLENVFGREGVGGTAFCCLCARAYVVYKVFGLAARRVLSVPVIFVPFKYAYLFCRFGMGNLAHFEFNIIATVS